MRQLIRNALALLALAPAAALAAGGLDVYYLPSATFGDSDAAAKGDGYGARLELDAGTVGFTAEYTDVDYKLFDFGSKQLRGGLGVALGEAAVIGAEYVKLEIDSDDFADGYGAHLQFDFPSAGPTRGYVRGGYLWLELEDEIVTPGGSEKMSGFEYSVGGTVAFGPHLDGVLEFRSTQIEDDDDFELAFEELRVGVRFLFDGPGRRKPGRG